MISPSIALFISIAGILILLRLKVRPGFAVFAGSVIVLLLAVPPHSIPSLLLQSLIDYQTLRLLVIIASALTLSRIMEEKGLLARLANTMESINPKLALHFIPAVIGLVPMPAGALVSATASQGIARRMSLTPEQSTFINYWFRHIWEFSLPMYPAIVLTSVIFSIPLSLVVTTLLPMCGLSILAGVIISYLGLRKVPKVKRRSSGNIALNFIRASWPILLLVVLILPGLEAMIAFPVTLIILALQQRVKWPETKRALKYGLNPMILLLLYAVMLYKATIEVSGAANMAFSDMQAIGLPPIIIIVILPLIIGIATGFSMTFAGVALPLLVPYVASGSSISSQTLLLAYTSGLIGVLMSPLHLCLVLSAEYFKANLARVYKYILPAVLMLETVAILIYYLVD